MRLVKKRCIRLVSLWLVFLCIISLAACGDTSENALRSSQTDTEAEQALPFTSLGKFQDLSIVAEQDNLILLIDESTGNVAVWDKNAQTLWSAVADDNALSYLRTESQKEQALSQLAITVCDSSAEESTYYSYTDCVKSNQFTLTSIDDGVCVGYRLGQTGDSANYPQVLTKKTVENDILPLLTDEEKEIFLRCYVEYTCDTTEESIRDELLNEYANFSQVDIYVTKQINARYKKQVYSALTRIGFTTADLQSEYDAAGYDVTVQELPSFYVPVEFYLQDGTLVTRIGCDNLSYSEESYKVTELKLLPYFGSCGSSDDGYMFLPDGCGILINLNNPNSQTLALDVYGADLSGNTEDAGVTQPCLMPVYGMSKSRQGYFSIIEEGASLATLNAQTSGSTLGINVLGPQFTLWAGISESADGLVRSSTIKKYAAEAYKGNITLRTYFLSGEDTGYSAMAEVYRQYLFAGKTAGSAQECSLFLETYGVINRQESFLGMPVTRQRTLSTLEFVQTMLEEFQSDGAGNILVQYRNWQNDSRKSALTESAELASELGTDRELNSFLQYCGDNNITFYPDYQMLYFYKNTLFDSVNLRKDTVFGIDGLTVYESPLGILAQGDDKTANQRYMLSFSRLSRLVGKVSSSLLQTGVNQVSLSNIGTDLYSNYSKQYFQDRESALLSVKETLQTLSGDCKILLEGGNAYTLAYVSQLTNVPTSGSNYTLTDAEVPFVQMVLHGYVNFSTTSINMSAENDTAFLKSVEYGSALKYTLNNVEVGIQQQTAYTDLFGTDYTVWLSTAKEQYSRYNEVYRSIESAVMIRHNQLQEDVYQTTYDNGTAVLVNYSETDVLLPNQLSVPARDFILVKAD